MPQPDCTASALRNTWIEDSIHLNAKAKHLRRLQLGLLLRGDDALCELIPMSAEEKPNRAVAQAANVTFELHTLGWEAFQNLCGHIAREILGQTVTVFSPGNDAGQDGAFQGTWQKSKEEAFSGRFVIQCKFTSRRDEHLGLGDLKEELLKAEKLAGRGLAQTYLLMSNAKVSGEAHKAIREAFLKIRGMEYFDLYGSEWITQQIIESKRLRATD